VIDYGQVPLLVKELKLIARTGATPARLASMGALAELAGAHRRDIDEWADHAKEVRKFLIDCIESYNTPVFWTEAKHWVKPEGFRLAMYIILGLSNSDRYLIKSAKERYVQAAIIMGLPYGYETFRKPRYSGLCFQALAEHILRYTA
jgi:hypothetical protein